MRRSVGVFFALCFYAGTVLAADQVFSDLDSRWTADLNAKRSRIRELVKKSYALELKGTADDVAVIQRVVKDKLIPLDDIAGYQALGVVFGDAVAADLNAEWKHVKDEYGEGPVLKIRGKTAAIGAMTIISKRIEDKGTVDAVALRDNLVKDVKQLESQFGADSK